METKYRITGDKMIYKMPQDVDHHCAGIISSEIDYVIENQGIRMLVMDFSDTDFMDSSGIGVVIGRSRLIHFFQGDLVALNVSERVNKIFRASGLHRIVRIEKENVEDR